MTDIYFDVETTTTSLDWPVSEAEIKPPGNYKKQETIEKWMLENEESEREKLRDKTALDTSLAEIICIGLAIDDGSVQTLEGPENEILDTFATALSFENHTRLIGFNILTFDIPLVFHRCIVHGIQPPMHFHMSNTSWGGQVIDIMSEWCGRRDYISQDKLCRILGIEGKGEIDGSMVPHLYRDGKIDVIAEYCAWDVEIVRSLHKRIIGK